MLCAERKRKQEVSGKVSFFGVGEIIFPDQFLLCFIIVRSCPPSFWEYFAVFWEAAQALTSYRREKTKVNTGSYPIPAKLV